MNTADHRYKHGKSRSRIYYLHKAMKNRCLNPNVAKYKDYGARGISVCDRWLKFENFLADMGEPELGMTLDRINNDGNYEPENCRWATAIEQQSHTRKTRTITYKGISKPVSQWAREMGIRANTLWCRVFTMKWPIDKAFNGPVGYR